MDHKQLEKAKQDVRLTQLEIDTRIIKTDIKTIKDNHLAHIESNMGSLDRKLEKLVNRVWAILLSIVLLIGPNLLATIIT